MCKFMTFPFIKDGVQSTASVSTSFKLRPRYRAPPDINDSELRHPDYVNKVPIQNCQVLCSTTTRCCTIQSNITNCQILKSQNNVKTVESCCKVECTSKHSITKCESCPSIFKILTIHKQQPQPNSSPQMQFTKTLVIMVHCMFRSICSKITPKLQQCISTGLPLPMYRYNSNRRPTHSYLNCRHKCSMQKRPKQSNKKHCFTPNKKHHSQVQSVFHLACMKTFYSFTVNITPPKECRISYCQKSSQCKSRCSSILMKNQNKRYQHPHNTQPSLCRPRTRIHQVISMMGPTQPMTRSTLFFTRCTINKHFSSFKNVKQCHYFL